MNPKMFYSLLGVTSLVVVLGTVCLYQLGYEVLTPVYVGITNAAGGQTEEQLLKLISESVTKKLDQENLDRLFQTIMSMANLDNPDDIKLVKSTLSENKHILSSILTKVMNSKYGNDPHKLPKTLLSSEISIKYKDMWRGHSLPIIVANPAGGVGNIMGQYATVYGLYKIYNVTAFITNLLKVNLNRFFDNVTMRAVDIGDTKEERTAMGWTELHKDHRTAPSTYFGLQLGAAGFMGPRRFYTSGCPIELQLFSIYREDFRHEFHFNEYLLHKANRVLSDFAQQAVLTKTDGSPTFISVHVRLKDYISHALKRWGVENIPDIYKGYLRRAMQYYKDRYQNTIFVFASDDLEYIEDFVKLSREKNIFISHGTQGEDMSLLTRCNHSIVTLGSFGFWTGFLSPGTTVYPDVRGHRAKSYHFTRRVIEEAQLDDFIPLPFEE
uniref:L-Fucosyltransferase n=1 Tax=Hirondellea gigas TaxID=1518452 RepID=A0A2P2HY54_9CRUS